ncbi:hypothetical protein GCM10020367_63630 [Streptomyces sannanensis]|uniref:Uncharacterized protein n=1 Tax=Streptomyces sannanensis TaxID=285536 RepID=A0ABP6SLZ6_9ACTN
MTMVDQLDRAVSDPVGLITDLVADVEKELDVKTIRAVATAVAGGRAKSRQLAKALAIRPAVLTDGRSPAPRAIGDLLIELRNVGAWAIAPPVCAECGKKLRTLQRKGQAWYCGVCGQETAECTACGNVRRAGFRDRKGLPRCSMCPDIDDRDPVTGVNELSSARSAATPHPAHSRSSPACPAAAAADSVRPTAPSADDSATSTPAPPTPPYAAPAPHRTPCSGVLVLFADKPNGCTRQVRVLAAPSSSGSTSSSPERPAPYPRSCSSSMTPWPAPNARPPR